MLLRDSGFSVASTVTTDLLLSFCIWTCFWALACLHLKAPTWQDFSCHHEFEFDFFWLYINSAAIFDRSGRYVITGSDDRLVKIWSMETAYCLASCRGHEVSLMSYNAHILQLFMFLSLISSSYMLHYFLFGWKGDITDLAVSSNNFMVASSSNDCIIRVVSIPFILLILSSLPA